MEISEISVGRGDVCGQHSWGGWEDGRVGGWSEPKEAAQSD